MSDAREVEIEAGSPPGRSGAPLRRVEAADVAVAAVAFAAEALLLALAMRRAVPVAALVAVHVGIVGLLAYWVHRRMARSASDCTVPLLLVIATFAAGPIGALALILALPLLARAPEPSELLAAWYRRIALSTEVDPALTLANIVAAGRSIDPAAPPPTSFEALMQRGSLHERQAALGLIARKFHPAYAPALKVALRSPEPVVRVQAAAVAARLRGELKRKLTAALDKAARGGGDPAAALALAGEIEGIVGSGLLDDGDRSRASAAIALLRTGDSGALGDGMGRRWSEGDADERREADLIAAGRFAELRALRKARRLSRPGLFRVRLPAPRTRSASA